MKLGDLKPGDRFLFKEFQLDATVPTGLCLVTSGVGHEPASTLCVELTSGAASYIGNDRLVTLILPAKCNAKV